MLASRNGHTETVKILLEQKGIDINAKDNDGFSAILNAAEFEKKEIIDMLKEIKGIEYDEQRIKEQWGKKRLMKINEENSKLLEEILRKVYPGMIMNGEEEEEENDPYKAARKPFNFWFVLSEFFVKDNS